MFISKTGPLDYKPFCDESLQFGAPDPEVKVKRKMILEKLEVLMC